MFLDVLASGGSKTSLLEFLEVLKSWRSSPVCKTTPECIVSYAASTPTDFENGVI